MWVLLGLAPFIVSELSPTAVSRVLARAQAPELVEAPTTWTAFRADGLIENAQRGLHLRGRHFRAADGSERWEQGAPEVEYISIRNIPEAKFYEWRRRDGDRWSVHPMQLPDGGWLPPQYAKGYPELTGATKVVEGIALLHQRDSGGREAWLAPSLNFFAVEVTASPLLGTLSRYSNIEIGAQPAHLFVPPHGAQLEYKPEPRGITTGSN